MIINQQKFLLDWGWNEFFEQQIENDPEYEFGKSTLARVVGEEKGRWRIQISSEISVWSELSGRFRHQVESRMDTPSFGDWIACHLEENQSVALI
ncbi:MAG: hypothetical protein H7326_10835 [Bdellovibrionaceae bacterium]|nr:hypothetical protein [Pseudobdellovibrionaceae bacterium]